MIQIFKTKQKTSMVRNNLEENETKMRHKSVDGYTGRLRYVTSKAIQAVVTMNTGPPALD